MRKRYYFIDVNRFNLHFDFFKHDENVTEKKQISGARFYTHMKSIGTQNNLVVIFEEKNRSMKFNVILLKEFKLKTFALKIYLLKSE